MRYRVFAIAVALAASWAIASSATAQQGSSTQQVTPDPAGNPDQELGRRFVMRPENLRFTCNQVGGAFRRIKERKMSSFLPLKKNSSRFSLKKVISYFRKGRQAKE